MTTFISMLRPVALAALTLAGSALQARPANVVTVMTGFHDADWFPAIHTGAGFNIMGSTPGPIPRSAGPYSYKASPSTSGFFGAGATADFRVSTHLAGDSITFTSDKSGAFAVGGNFIGSDISGATGANSLDFVSAGTVSSLVLSSVAAAAPIWPAAAENLVLSQAAAVPEPETCALMLAGVGFVGFLARRRRA